MKIGDLVEVNGGYQGVVVGIELIYPRHPESPPRSLEIMWSGHQPEYAFRNNNQFSSVSAMAVKRVISRA